MSRLIDADAFKEYMRKALEETRDYYPDKGEWAEAITEQFCEDIDDQPTVEPQRWIPCSERLPEKAEGRYWVCTNTGYQCQCRWTDDVYGLGSNGEWAWKIFDIPQYSHVVAWMPLPEPYKEDKT